jgi:phosphopantetheinyl transferase (holo-ACP synthase)
VAKIIRIADKFLNEEEKNQWSMENSEGTVKQITLLWSCKESVFKWYGNGEVDFSEHIQLKKQDEENETINCFFSKNKLQLIIHYRQFDGLVLAW